MKKLVLLLLSFAIVGVVYRWVSAGPEPSVSLYWYEALDPTVGPGVSAPQYQLLVRTDVPSLYAHTGTSPTAWTKIGAGTGGGTGTVTSVTCGSDLTCAPNPITTTGTVSVSSIADQRLYGNVSGASAAPSALTGTQATTLLDVFTTTLKGLVPPPGSATGTKYLSDAGMWTTPTGTGVSGTATHLAAFATSTTVGNAAGGSTDDGTTTTIGDNLTGTKAFSLSASITPAAFTGVRMDNYNPAGLSTTYVIDQQVTSSTTITGLAAQPTGTQIDFRNTASSVASLTFSNLDANSLAANQFGLPGGTNWIVPPGSSLLLRYNGTNWRAISVVTTDLPTLTVDGPLTANGGITMAAATTLSGNTGRILAGALALTGATTVAVSGTINNWNPTFSPVTDGSYVSIVRVTTSAPLTLTGYTNASFFGRQLYLENVGSGAITINNQDAGSTAGDRFITPSGSALTVAVGATMHMYYDLTLTRWIVDYVSTSAGGSGTANTLAAWGAAGVLGNTAGPVTDDGTTFTVGAGGYKVTEASGDVIMPETDTTGTVTATATSGTVNNWDPTGGSPGNLSGLYIAREAPTAALTLTGLIAGNAGQILVIRNTSATAANTIVLNNESASSTAANRFTLGNAASTTIPAGGSCALRYSSTASRWEPIAGCGTSTLTALSNATISPTDTGTLNDYTPTGLASATIIRWAGSVAATINGLTGGQDGRQIYICNVSTSSVSLTIANENAGSTAANRFWLENNSGLVLTGNSGNTNTCAQFLYDSTSSRWRLVSYNSTSINAPTTFVGGATMQNALNVSTSSASLNMQTGAHIRSSGTSPVATSCGTSPAVVGGDTAFRLTIGSAASNACTITFNQAFTTNAPVCVIYPEGTATAPQMTLSTSAITLGGTVTSSGVYDIHCIAPN